MADPELTQAETRELTQLQTTVTAIQTQIERLRRANAPPELVEQLQARLQTAEQRRRGLLAEFTTGQSRRGR